MAVVTADIKARLSTQSGAAGNSTASTPAASIGKYMSTTDIVDASVENLFNNVTAAQAISGVTLYRCFFVYNSHGSQTWKDVRAWMSSQLAGGGEVSIGLDPAGVVTYNQAGAQAAAPVDELTAPAGVVFSLPTTEAAALVIGDIAINKCAAIWLKMTVPIDVASLNLDNVIVQVKGQSDP